MNDPIFRAMRDQWEPPAQLLEQLERRLDEEPATAHGENSGGGVGPSSSAADGVPPGRALRPWRAALSGIAACAAMVVAIATTGNGADPAAHIPVAEATTSAPAATPTGTQPSADAQAIGSAAADYADLYASVQAAWASTEQSSWTSAESSRSMIATDSAGPLTLEAAPSVDDGAGSVDSSSTNVQVEGIDEGDIVKVDGSTLYVASQGQVAIIDAAGAGTREVSRIDTADDAPPDGGASGSDPVAGMATSGPVIDMMVSDGVLAVLLNQYRPRGLDALAGDVATVPFDAAMTEVLLYDVTDPANPRYVTAIGHSGAY
ncbi:MAG: beta-propeller domain-containing protein, partial [Bifidobacteriaceae bacterium]|nr:beta-propeller domain-containing protein [Bifidobacteriaceae bacterium]